MKAIIFSLSIVLVCSFQASSQEKWTCYTDDAVLLMDDYTTLGVFEYVDGSLWMVTDRGINIFKDGQWKKIDKKTELLRNKIGAYLVDSQDRIWIGTGSPDMFFDGMALGQLYHGGVVIFDGKTWKPMNTKEMGIKAPVITRMFETSKGDIWLAVSSVRPGAERGGPFAKGALLRFSNDEWTVYKEGKIPCWDCEFVKGFYEDDNGRLFFTAAHGLFYFEDGDFHEVKKDDGYNFRTFAPTAMFLDSKKNFWLAAPARIAKYDGKQWRTFNRKNGLPSADWWPLGFSETADNTIILSTGNGLFYYDNADEWEHEKIKFLHGNSHVDPQGRIWVATNKGLLIKDGDDKKLHKDMPKVWATVKDNDGGVWALSKNKGVKRYKNGQWERFDKDNQLPSDKILSGYVTKDGTVWIATTKGICSCETD